jgi:tetratricopeptide (TPR) repeat protein
MRARLLSREAEVLQESGRREEALVAAERAVSLWEHADAVDDLERVHAYQSYARILGGLERWEDAQRAAERALLLDQALLGPEHPEVGRTHKYIGDFLMMRGRYADARPYYERAIAIAEASVGHESNDIRGAYNGLASVLQHAGQPAEALRLFGEAIAIEERLSGPDSSSGHAIRLNMADTLRALGRRSEAQQMCERVLSSLQSGLAAGRSNPFNLPGALDCLGRLLGDRREYARAIVLHQRALAMYAGGNLDRPSHAATLVHLAQAYLAIGRTTDALPALERAVKVFDAVECDAGDAGDAHFALAQALWIAGTDRPQARARAEQAREDFVRAGALRQQDLASVIAWLSNRA